MSTEDKGPGSSVESRRQDSLDEDPSHTSETPVLWVQTEDEASRW